MDMAREFAASYNTVVVLKGDERNQTIVAEPQGNIYINTTGNRYMATAGTGDVLTGIIAGFIAQGLTVFEAAILGVYIHGLSGDFAVQDKSVSLIASDIIGYLPEAFKELFAQRKAMISSDMRSGIPRREIDNIALFFGLKLKRDDQQIPDHGRLAQLIIVPTEDGSRKVIRKSRWDRKGTLWEPELFDYLRAQDTALEIPEVILDSQEKPLYIKDKAIFTVYDFIPGDIVELERLSVRMKENIIRFLAKLHVYTMGGVNFPRGVRTADSIVEFAGEYRKEEKLDKKYFALKEKGEENLAPAEKLLVDNYKFIKEQILVLKNNLRSVYEKLPRCIIHGDLRPENVKFIGEKLSGVFDWDTAREEVRVYDVVRSLFFDLHKDGLALNLEELKNWVIAYQKAAEALGYPLSEEEIRAIPEMVRARLLNQFIWLVRWNTLERIQRSPEEIEIFENTVRALVVLDNLGWEGFVQEILSVNNWNARNSFREWKFARDLMQKISGGIDDTGLLILEAGKTTRKEYLLRIGIYVFTADPLHNAHLKLIEATKDITLVPGKKLNEIVVISSLKHLWKGLDGMSLVDRIVTTKVVLEELWGKEESLPRKFFMVNTGLYLEMAEALRKFYREIYNQEIETYFIVGKDSMQVTLDAKNRAITEKLLNENNFIVMDRQAKRIEDTPEYQQFTGLSHKIISRPFKLPVSQAKISSTRLREMVSGGMDIGKFVPAVINSFIIESGVYKALPAYDLRQQELEALLREKDNGAASPVDKETRIEPGVGIIGSWLSGSAVKSDGICNNARMFAFSKDIDWEGRKRLPFVVHGQLNLFRWYWELNNVARNSFSKKENSRLEFVYVELFGSCSYLAKDGWVDLTWVEDIDVGLIFKSHEELIDHDLTRDVPIEWLMNAQRRKYGEALYKRFCEYPELKVGKYDRRYIEVISKKIDVCLEEEGWWMDVRELAGLCAVSLRSQEMSKRSILILRLAGVENWYCYAQKFANKILTKEDIDFIRSVAKKFEQDIFAGLQIDKDFIRTRLNPPYLVSSPVNITDEDFFMTFEGPAYYPASELDLRSIIWLAKLFPKLKRLAYRDVLDPEEMNAATIFKPWEDDGPDASLSWRYYGPEDMLLLQRQMQKALGQFKYCNELVIEQNKSFVRIISAENMELQLQLVFMENIKSAPWMNNRTIEIDFMVSLCQLSRV